MNSIIIEDETIAAQALQSLIEETAPDVKILTVLQSIDESVEWFHQNMMPDLVFMDIHLADGSSFSIFEEVKITCPIIFTTAYDEYALKAFKVNSIDYLLKPIDKKELEQAIYKFRHLSGKEISGELINNLLQNIRQVKSAHKTHFLVSYKDKLIPLPVNEIAYIYIDSGSVKAVTFSDKPYYLDQTLDLLSEQLNPECFFRANRQYIIAHKAVKDASFWFAGKLSVNLTVPVPEKIVVSKAKVGEFKKWLAG
ncbi:MAG: LytTR family DNA-binding domain-containing protein [Candidatus Azobacteroides sp.]|nr:LytTR family DNA-binding domain-containing protein [Candidatus Azobacteroides sp.]